MRYTPVFYTLAVLAAILASGCSPGDRPAQVTATGSAGAASPLLVRPDGTYPVKALEKDAVVVKVIQNGVQNLQQAPSIEAGLMANLEKMAAFVHRACTTGARPDFLLFNEFPLTGYSAGSREEKLKFTITIPGAETERLGALARDCDTYIIFGSYARDDDWPGHILSINTVLDRQGRIAQKFWKTRNVTRLTPGEEIPTTTIESVRDRFRARYGIEAEFPVLQTEYGNIAVSTVQLDPFVFAAFAMRGVEIMFRTATLFSTDDVKATARFHNVYSAMSNITFPADSPVAAMGGHSLIVGPRGEVLAEDATNNEGIIEATIPIAEFRKGRRIPRYPLEVVAPVFSQYRQEVPLNQMDLPPGELPGTGADMKALLDRVSRWLHPAAPDKGQL
ncbi:MAG: nitrilase-related carbon-nitrogen hydrolase [Gammaproteobacteria bacterium]